MKWFSFFVLWICVAACPPALGENPVFLVHGGGPERIVSMARFREHLKDYGFSAERVIELKYDYKADLDCIVLQLSGQISQEMGRYSPDQKFDMVAHSLGHFVGLFAILKTGLSQRFERVIALAGVARGQDSPKWMCAAGRCGKTMPLLTPFDNDFVHDYLERYHSEISELRHCAIYSVDDKFVLRPYDAGVLPGGTEKQLSGIGHLEFIRSADIIPIIDAACYQGNLGNPK